MKFAQSLGIPVAEITILPTTSGRPVFIAKRFDRTPDGKKIHTEDLAQATGLPPASKYTGSIEQIVKAIFANERKTAPSTERDRENFLNVTLFNYLIGNPDNHFKNFSVIHGVNGGDRTLSLTPFYDLFPAKVYAKNDNEETGITLLGRRTNFNLEDFCDLEERLGMSRGSADKFAALFQNKLSELTRISNIFGLQKDILGEWNSLISMRIADLNRSGKRSIAIPGVSIKDSQHWDEKLETLAHEELGAIESISDIPKPTDNPSAAQRSDEKARKPGQPCISGGACKNPRGSATILKSYAADGQCSYCRTT
jgi:serine/threonine-protein kinase HipA